MAFQQLLPDLYCWSDVANVYVLKDGKSAMLFDLGDGSVLDHLGEIGVSQVEWVLFTHHHREQCQGAPKLRGHAAARGVQIAAPEAERAFFERPTEFRRMRATLGDPFSVYGASFVRPPVEPIKLDRTFQKMDDFAWHGRELWCVDTRGNSPGGMSYLWKTEGRWVAISGDAMLADARLHTWFDSEWDYGFAKGLYALANSAAQLEGYRPLWLFPSHGPAIREPSAQLAAFQTKLRELTRHYLRGYEVQTFAGTCQDRVSQPTSVPHIWQVSPHLFKFKGPDYWPNFELLLADSGKALVIDCGLFDKAFLDKCLERMRERLGLKQIDAVIVTHMHGDHCQEAPHLKEKWGAQIWTMDRVAAKCRYPERYDYAAPINAYGKGFDFVAFDRILRDGETFEWEGYTLTVDWMPGQTEFALCLHGQIDGRLMAFTGDNLFGSTVDPAQTGHEAVVAHNSGILEEGYLYAANYLHGLQPDIILGGHSWVMDKPREMIERYRQGALDLRRAFQALSTDEDYRYVFDPYWVRADPYRVHVPLGGQGECVVWVRNFRERPQRYRIAIHTPAGVTATPAVLEGSSPAESSVRIPLVFKAAQNAPQGVQIAALDITLDGQRYGEWFDVMLQVGDKGAPPPPKGSGEKGSGY